MRGFLPKCPRRAGDDGWRYRGGARTHHRDAAAAASLSRPLLIVIITSLIINLPGSPRAIATCLDAAFAAVPDCVNLIGGVRLETDPERVRAYRPHT